MTRLETAQVAYWAAFRVPPPRPWGVSEEVLAEALERAIVSGRRLPENYDWYADLPRDAVA